MKVIREPGGRRLSQGLHKGQRSSYTESVAFGRTDWSRPLLLTAVGKAVSHANQTSLNLTPLHGKAHILKLPIAYIGAALKHVQAVAEQFTQADRWALLLRYVIARIAPTIGPSRPPAGLTASG